MVIVFLCQVSLSSSLRKMNGRKDVGGDMGDEDLNCCKSFDSSAVLRCNCVAVIVICKGGI